MYSSVFFLILVLANVFILLSYFLVSSICEMKLYSPYIISDDQSLPQRSRQDCDNWSNNEINPRLLVAVLHLKSSAWRVEGITGTSFLQVAAMACICQCLSHVCYSLSIMPVILSSYTMELVVRQCVVLQVCTLAALIELTGEMLLRILLAQLSTVTRLAGVKFSDSWWIWL